MYREEDGHPSDGLTMIRPSSDDSDSWQSHPRFYLLICRDKFARLVNKYCDSETATLCQWRADFIRQAFIKKVPVKSLSAITYCISCSLNFLNIDCLDHVVAHEAECEIEITPNNAIECGNACHDIEQVFSVACTFQCLLFAFFELRPYQLIHIFKLY